MQRSNKVEQSTTESVEYDKSRTIYIIILIVELLLLLTTIVLSLTLGRYKTTLSDIFNALFHPSENEDVVRIVKLSRLPRLIASLTVGMALSVTGLVYQDIFCNRMASPDLLGVSSGAGVGAAVGMLCGAGFITMSVTAFLGGILAVSLTLVTAKLFRNKDKQISLILSGIIIGGLMTSLLGFCKFVADDKQLATITFWLLGGFYNVTYKQLAVVVPFIIVGVFALYMMRWQIMMLRNGNKDARMHGINSTAIKYSAIVVATIITALSVCISGTIGWIGLAIPNLMRLCVKNDGKRLMGITIISGMIFTAICDLLARSITNSEIPVGVFTGVLGSIVFVIILVVRRFSYAKSN